MAFIRSMTEDETAHGSWQRQKDRAPARESRTGRLALLAAAVLILLALIWALIGP